MLFPKVGVIGNEYRGLTSVTEEYTGADRTVEVKRTIDTQCLTVSYGQ